MAYQQTVYSLHSCTTIEGCSSAIIFDDYEKLITKLKALYCIQKPYRKWIEKIQNSLSNGGIGSIQFDLPYEEDEDFYNDKIFITIATLPI